MKNDSNYAFSDSGASSSDFEDLQSAYDALCVEALALKKSELNLKGKLVESSKSYDLLKNELESVKKEVYDLQHEKESLLEQIEVIENDCRSLFEVRTSVLTKIDKLEKEVLACNEKSEDMSIGASRLNKMLNLGKESGDRRV